MAQDAVEMEYKSQMAQFSELKLLLSELKLLLSEKHLKKNYKILNKHDIHSHS